MGLRRRLTILAVIGVTLVGTGLVALAALWGGAGARPAAQALIIATVVGGGAALATVWRAHDMSVAPLEEMATRAGRAPVAPGEVLRGPADPEVRVVAGALEDAAARLSAREEELDRARRSFREALSRLGDVLVATHDESGIIEAVAEMALLVVPGRTAVYLRPRGVPGRLESTHVRGAPCPPLHLDGAGLAGAAAASGGLALLRPEPTVGAPVGAVPATAVTVRPGELDESEPNVDVGVAAPLFGAGRVIGVLAVYGSTDGRPFGDDQVALLVSLLRQAEVAINNVELHVQARREALTDGVTGLWNRRQFDIRLREAIAAAQRFGETFAVALFDLDDFKRINDTYDHLTGDAALVHFSAILRGLTRDVDVVSRWGGEEFAVLLQRTAPDAAVAVVERVLDALRRTPLEREGRSISFTASAGVAMVPADAHTGPAIVAAADAALLQAKAAGKDRLERASLGGDPAPAPPATWRRSREESPPDEPQP